jgi:hypothetical protein
MIFLFAVGGYNFGETAPLDTELSQGSLEILGFLGVFGTVLLVLYFLNVYWTFRSYRILKRIEEKLKR